MEKLGKLSKKQADEKRESASLIESGFSDNPEHDALIFSNAGIANEAELIKIFNNKDDNSKDAIKNENNEREENGSEILKQNLETLVNLYQLDLDAGKYDFDETLKIKAETRLEIAKRNMENGHVTDPYEFILFMRVMKKQTLESIQNLNKPQEIKDEIIKLVNRMDIPDLPFPKTWKDERLTREQVEDFRQVLSQ